MSKICKYCIHENTKTCKQCQRNGYGNEDWFSEKCCGNCVKFENPNEIKECSGELICTGTDKNDFCTWGWKPKRSKDENKTN